MTQFLYAGHVEEDSRSMASNEKQVHKQNYQKTSALFARYIIVSGSRNGTGICQDETVYSTMLERRFVSFMSLLWRSLPGEPCTRFRNFTLYNFKKEKEKTPVRE